MGTIIIIAVLVVLVLFAFRGSFAHFKGEGGCCGGGGSEPKQKKKKLAGEVIATKIISIEGMYCENCKNTVEKYINQIDGASAQVNLKKNIAVVQLDRPVEDTDLRTAVARAGFTVAGIEQMEA